MFNKINKAFKKDDKKKIKEIQARINSILEEVGEVLERRNVNFYEMSDVLQNLNARYHQNIFNQFKSLGNKINEERKLKDIETQRANDLIEKYEQWTTCNKKTI